MRHLARLAAVAGLSTALLATACGGVTDVLAGLSPSQVITLASSKVTGQSYRMAVHGNVAIDAGQVQGLPPGTLDQMSSVLKNFTVDGQGDVQDAQHERMTMSLALPGGGDRKFVAVLYGGSYYVSLDGGRTFSDAGSFNLQGVAASPDDVKSLLNGTTNPKNLGRTVHDGQSVEHIQATLGPNYFNDMLDKVTGSGEMASAVQALRGLFRQVLSVRSGSVDVYVRTLDGRVEDVDSKVVLALDMGRLMTALVQQFGAQASPDSRVSQISGSLLMTVSGSDRFSDFGAAIRVGKPSVDPNAPGFDSLFSGGA